MLFPRLNAALERALQARGYVEPTEVQAAVLAPEADGRDLLVSARTGSGKTVAYGVAFAPDLLGEAERAGDPGAPLALVIAPTRELAMQVQGELEWLYAQAGARVVACVGGMDARAEARKLQNGCHIVVGTPGRLKDHIQRNQLDLSAIKVAVLDEADEMLDLGFSEDLGFILEAAPASRRTLLFSATIAHAIASLARKFQTNALRIDTVDRSRPHEDIEYRAIRTAPGEDFGALVNVLRASDSRAALVFCATRDGVRALHARLDGHGFAAVALSGELSQTDRTHALAALRDGRASVCVATDVAARGLDLPELDLVVHFDLPNGAEALLHRSGRTGRAGRKGVCALMVAPRGRRRAEQLLMTARVSARWMAPPDAAAIRAADRARLEQDAVLTAPAIADEADQAAALLTAHGPDAVALALLRLHRARMPAPAEITAAMESSRGAEPAPRGDIGPTQWFRLNVGRAKNADPKWILPLLCRLGDVTRKDIGAIRIFDRETKFELVAGAVDGFLAAIAKADLDDLTIAATAPDRPAGSPPGRPTGPRFERAPTRRAEPLPAEVLVVPPPIAEPPSIAEPPQPPAKRGFKPNGGKPFPKPFGKKPGFGKPASGKPTFGKPFRKPARAAAG